jgi:hypothetical protein
MNGLKLFVVGAKTADPSEWMGELALVIANDAEEAKLLADATHDSATEIHFRNPIVLMRDEDHGFVL